MVEVRGKSLWRRFKNIQCSGFWLILDMVCIETCKRIINVTAMYNLYFPSSLVSLGSGQSDTSYFIYLRHEC